MSQSKATAIKLIHADNRLQAGPFKALGCLIEEIHKFRGQIWTVYRQSFRSSYHGTGLGVAWNFILPIIPLTVYLFLSKIRVFPNFDGIDGATYITFGVMVWFIFAGFVQLPINTIQLRNQEAMKTSLPLSASIVSSFAGLAFETLVRICFVLVIMIWMKSWPASSAPALMLVLVPAFFLFFGAGLILSILNVINKDVSRLTFIVLQYGIFVSGAIFPLGNAGWVATLNKINPFSVFIQASREMVFKGAISEIFPLALWSSVSLIIFLIGCRLFYVMEYRIRDIS